MTHLVDAHSLIWALDNPSKLSVAAAAALQDPTNQLLLSAGTMWELSIKVGLGKLTLSLPFRPWLEKAIADLGLSVLPITLDHVECQAALPFHHRDPFDRLLVAQSIIERFPLVSADGVLDQYGIQRVWWPVDCHGLSDGFARTTFRPLWTTNDERYTLRRRSAMALLAFGEIGALWRASGDFP